MCSDDKFGGVIMKRKNRTSITWLLLAVIVVISLTVGVCALWLPDRPPQLLGAAREATSAPVNTQEYVGAQQITVIPTVSAARNLIINATGTVTADWSANGLESGHAALRVNDRVVVALNTATPLYRDLNVGDVGDDVRALNNELNRLGLNAVPDSDTYEWATSDGVRQLMNNCGNTSDGALALSDVLWISDRTVRVGSWDAVEGSRVQAGTAIGQVAGTLTKLTIKNGQVADQDRTITVMGQTGTLPAGQTEITDAKFCEQVSATDDYRSMDEAALAAGINASIALHTPIQVLRVPAAAVFGVQDTKGCIVPVSPGDNSNNADTVSKIVKITIVGSELGASLVASVDGDDMTAITDVAIGSRLDDLVCR